LTPKPSKEASTNILPVYFLRGRQEEQDNVMHNNSQDSASTSHAMQKAINRVQESAQLTT
jgi:hypothetical protein